jgi:hypothetical protein
MILTEQVANFVCKCMSKKPFGLNAELLSTLYDPEVKHVNGAGSSVFVTGSRRRPQVFNARLDFSVVVLNQGDPFRTISGVRIFSTKAFVPQSAGHLAYRSSSSPESGQYTHLTSTLASLRMLDATDAALKSNPLSTWA